MTEWREIPWHDGGIHSLEFSDLPDFAKEGLGKASKKDLKPLGRHGN